MNFQKFILFFIFFFYPIYSIYSNDYQIVNADPSLMLRERPTIHSKVIGVIPNKHIVKLIEKTNNTEIINNIKGTWVKVNWSNKIGYVFGGYLSNIDIDRVTSLKSDITTIDLTDSKKLLIKSNGSIDYYLLISNEHPYLASIKNGKIISKLLISDGKLKDYKIEFNHKNFSFELTVQLFEPMGSSSGVATYDVQLVQWSSKKVGYFIDYLVLSPGESIPVYSYKAVTLNDKYEFEPDSFTTNGYALNVENKIDPFLCWSTHFFKDSNKFKIIFISCDVENHNDILFLFFNTAKNKFEILKN